MKAPSARSARPPPSVMPTTASTGTSEMAIATPARMSETSLRARANDPASAGGDGDAQVEEGRRRAAHDLGVHVERHAVERSAGR